MKLEPSLETLQKQIELRVLLGAQAGSRLTLAPGDYELGAGDDCAIILSGPKIESLHALLSFDGETPSITPQEGKVSDAQGNEITGTFVLDLGMPIEIGGIWIAIDDIDAEWPDPTDVVPVMPAIPTPAPVANESAPTPASLPVKQKTSTGIKKLLVTAGISLSLLAVAGLGLLFWIAEMEKNQKIMAARVKVPIPDPPSLRLVQNVVATSGSGSAIEISINRSRQVVVKGFVPDESTRDSLLKSLAKIQPAPKAELFIDGEMQNTAVKLIAEKISPSKAMLRVGNVSGGVLSLEGAVTTQSVRESVMDLLYAGVPGLQRVNASIVLAEDLPQLLQDQLVSTGLSKKMQIIEKQPEFVLRGTLTEEELKRWEGLIVNYTERYGKLLPVKATVRLMLRKPPVQVQTIVGGDMPFVMTETGERIARGGDINGNTLLSIKDTEIIFEGSERFRIGR